MAIFWTKKAYFTSSNFLAIKMYRQGHPAMGPDNTYIYMITEITKIVDSIYIIKLAPQGENMKYEAGQYCKLLTDNMFKAYSIACAMNENNTLEIHFRQTHKNKKALLTFSSGHFMKISGPYGAVVYTNQDSPSLFIAEGIAIAPFKAIFESQSFNRGTCNVHFVWILKRREEAYILERILELQKKRKHFTFEIVINIEMSENSINDIIYRNYKIIKGKNIYVAGSESLNIQIINMCTHFGIPINLIISDYKVCNEKVHSRLATL